MDNLRNLTMKDILGRKTEAEKKVLSVLDLSKKNVLERNKPDKDGFVPLITTATLDIDSLGEEAGETINEKLDFVVILVNENRKKQIGSHAMRLLLDTDDPLREYETIGDERVYTWGTGLKAVYGQKKGKRKDSESRKPRVAIQITKRWRHEGDSPVGEPTYQLRRVIERL